MTTKCIDFAFGLNWFKIFQIIISNYTNRNLSTERFVIRRISDLVRLNIYEIGDLMLHVG